MRIFLQAHGGGLDMSVPTTPESVSAALGGRSFVEGAYRVHTSASAVSMTASCERAFPEYRGRWTVFGYDWLGRQFVVDRGRAKLVSIVDPGFAEVLETPASLSDFHDVEIMQYADDVVMLSYLREWRQSGRVAPNPTQCIGFTKPPFLGGADEMTNMELSDMNVYFELFTQIWSKVRDLPTGTAVDFTISN